MHLSTSLLLFLQALALVGQHPATLEWRSFSPADGAFSVQVPGTPAEHKSTIKTVDGPVDVLVYEVGLPASEGKFVVSVSEFPASSMKPGTEDKRLDNARDGAVAKSKGKLEGEKSLLLDSYPGREFVIKTQGKGTVVMRIYAVKNRLYQLLVVGNAEVAKAQDAQKFLSSFKLSGK